MKLLTGALFLALASSQAYALEPWESDYKFPSLEEQVEQANLIIIKQMVETAKEDPDFAGTIFTATYKDAIVGVVDRRSEPRRPSTTPPARDKFMELSQSLGSQAQGKLRLEYKIDRRADGSETETWIFEVDAGWKAESEMKESMGKYHR